MINQNGEVPPMYLTIKDHKPVKEGELPSTRPIVSGCQSLSRHLSNILSEIVESLSQSVEDSGEVISTEDLISKIEEYNAKIRSGEISDEELILLGIDAVALFPSLDPEQTAKEVREEFVRSEMVLDPEVWKWEELVTYVAMNHTQEEIDKLGLSQVIPRRKFAKGVRPGVTSDDALSGKERYSQ